MKTPNDTSRWDAPLGVLIAFVLYTISAIVGSALMPLLHAFITWDSSPWYRYVGDFWFYFRFGILIGLAATLYYSVKKAKR